MKTQVDSLQSSASISQAITSLGEIAAQISGAVAQTQGAVDSLDAVASDLKDGFDKASSCKKLAGLSKPLYVRSTTSSAVPRPGIDWSEKPPSIDSARARMFFRPCPAAVSSPLKPSPLSVIVT